MAQGGWFPDSTRSPSPCYRPLANIPAQDHACPQGKCSWGQEENLGLTPQNQPVPPHPAGSPQKGAKALGARQRDSTAWQGAGRPACSLIGVDSTGALPELQCLLEPLSSSSPSSGLQKPGRFSEREQATAIERKQIKTRRKSSGKPCREAPFCVNMLCPQTKNKGKPQEGSECLDNIRFGVCLGVS